MRIRHIELNGFKSFAARTVLELPPGVTAIVGPNGCGKSNVVDAIRWVLGEQSPKHLRGGVMEDVIFAGNAEQAPLGMAEVSLLIERDENDLRALERGGSGEGGDRDGADLLLAAELAHASEILVTRRYFRSGESEYLINRQPCRLKDITELFLGTGVGTKAYAIIEQGRVEQLVNAKPEEMRLFLEEAAGTTRFRTRRMAAERKLERTRENLVRVLDIVHELERQMAALQRQAKRAEEYHRIKDELRALDLRVMATRQRAWREEVAALGAQVAALRAEEATLHVQLRDTQVAADASRQRRHEAERRLRDVSMAIAQERLRAGEAGTRYENVVARAGELADRSAEACRQGEQLRQRLALVAAEVAELEGLATALHEEQVAAEAACDAAERGLQALAEDGAALERALEQAQNALGAAAAEEERLRHRWAALGSQRVDIESKRQRLAVEQEALARRLEHNRRQDEALGIRESALEEERAALDAAGSRLAAQGQRLAKREEDAARACEQTRTALTQLQSRIDSLRQLQARYEGCTRGTSTLLAREAGASVLLANVLHVPAAFERAVAAALGSRLAHVVVADATMARDALAWLRGSGGGSATVIPRTLAGAPAPEEPMGRRLRDMIGVESGYEALADRLLGTVLVADDLDQAIRLWDAAKGAASVVTLAGDAIDAVGAMSGGSEPPLEEILLARARELRELEAAVEETRRRAEAAERELAGLRKELSDLALRTRETEERHRALQLELLAVRKDRERLEEERGRIAAELELGTLEASSLAGAEGEVGEALASVTAALEAASATVRRRRDELARQQEAQGQWRERYAEREGARTQAAVAVASVAERRRATEAALQRLRASASDMAERVAQAEQRAAEAAAEAARMRAEAERIAAIRAEAETLAAQLSGEREELIAEIAAADAVLSTDDLAQRTAHERLEALQAERSGHEVALAERRVALDQLAERLAERYGLTPDALDEVDVSADSDREVEGARAEELRARLARLGDVNPAAVTELAEIRERYEFLSSQRTDLERSLDDLKQTISRLTRTSRQRFDETFTAANERLDEVFPKLFPGGKARLVLVPPADGGEPGVEIVVQPVGKRLQSLSLLSGGEKALTATALVFSLFLIRPTPFCVLDEVDAPLDEANIGRFNQLVAEMAGRTQFMLITHNRRTMEVADTLYGITMEEAGVSKVVSVRLSEAA